jgi:hypothetical protein
MDRMTAHTRAYDLCLAEAATDAAGFMRRVAGYCALLMAENAATHPQPRSGDALREAARSLLRHSQGLGDAFAPLLRAHLAATHRELSRDAAAAEPEIASAQQAGSAVEIARLAVAVQARAQSELVEFDALVSAAQGLHVVVQGRNPLSPMAYARCVHAATQALAVPSRHRAAWLRFLGEAMGRELATAYGVASRQLRARGVREAGFMFNPASRAALDAWR